MTGRRVLVLGEADAKVGVLVSVRAEVIPESRPFMRVLGHAAVLETRALRTEKTIRYE